MNYGIHQDRRIQKKIRACEHKEAEDKKNAHNGPASSLVCRNETVALEACPWFPHGGRSASNSLLFLACNVSFR